MPWRNRKDASAAAIRSSTLTVLPSSAVTGPCSHRANRVKELTEGWQMPVVVAPKTVVEDFPIAAMP